MLAPPPLAQHQPLPHSLCLTVKQHGGAQHGVAWSGVAWLDSCMCAFAVSCTSWLFRGPFVLPALLITAQQLDTVQPSRLSDCQ